MVIFAFSAIVGLGLAGGFGFESGHKLPASPVWFKLKIDRLDTWSDIKHCIYDTRVCDYLITRSLTLKSYEFTNSKLSPLETGCCRPPGECEMEYVNATFWKRPLNYNFARDTSPYYADCDTWENNSTSMCFDCQSCKDAFFWTIESKWQRLGVFIAVMSIFLFLSHFALLISIMSETCDS
nr:tetraspanin-15 [Fagopyrum tataricum]